MDIAYSFDGVDPLLFAAELNEAERAVQNSARKFADTVLKPKVKAAFRSEQFDREIITQMGRHGLLASGIAKQYGGSELNATSYGLIARELERVDSGYRTIFSVSSSLVARAIDLFGDEAQKQHYLSRIAKGELVVSFGLTEPEHGSNPGGMETRAEKQEDYYILNGHKRWIGLTPYADIFVVWARDQEGTVCGFIVERDLPGIETPLIEGKYSLRVAPTGEIRMHQVKVPVAAKLPGANSLSAPLHCLDAARYSIAWGVLGAAENCYEIALQYVKQRQQFNQPLAAHQLVQQKLVDMKTELTLALHACLRLSRCIEMGKGSPEMISMMKRHCVAMALRIARHARDMLGGNGILDEYGIIRHMMNLEAVNTYEGTHDIHTLILGRALTGMQAFK